MFADIRLSASTVLSAELCGLGHLLGSTPGNHWRLCAQLYQGGRECFAVILSAEDAAVTWGRLAIVQGQIADESNNIDTHVLPQGEG